MVLSVPSFAEENMPANAGYSSAPASSNPDAPAGQRMREAGREMKQAGADTAAAAKDTFHGTTRSVKDTTITAEVKTALKKDDQIRSSEIHVKTSGVVVTLKGNVASPEMAARAAQIAEQSKGVNGVNNELAVASSARSD
jgi:osmotically-inducible protein OsmY